MEAYAPPTPPPYRSIGPLLTDSFNWLNLSVTCVLTFGVNYGIDYAMHLDNVEVAVINGSNFVIGVLATVVIIAVLSFFGSGSVRDRILKGKTRPVAQLALCDTLLKRVLFFSMAEPMWKVRLPRFILQVLLFPGLLVIFVVYGICWFVSGCGSLPTNACTVPLAQYCLYTELWKITIASIVFTINYISAHNDAQPELHPELTVGIITSDAKYGA